MSNPIFKQIKEDILLTQKIVKVPNDPDLSGTSDWQDRKPLSPENSLILSLFLNFLDRSEVFCPDVFPSSSIAGLYLLDHTLFFVWDEWVESDVSVVIFAQATSAELAKDYLYRQIKKLQEIIQSMPDILDITEKSIDHSIRMEQIQQFIKNRIHHTTLNKFSGWGASKRKDHVLKIIDRYFEVFGEYPSNYEILHSGGMAHPWLNISVKELSEKLEYSSKRLHLPTFESLAALDKETLLFTEAVLKLCNSSQIVGAYINSDGNEAVVYQTSGQLFQVVVPSNSSPESLTLRFRIYVEGLSSSDLLAITFCEALTSKYEILQPNILDNVQHDLNEIVRNPFNFSDLRLQRVQKIENLIEKEAFLRKIS